MASATDTEAAELSSALERLIRNRDFSLLLPFLLGFASSHSDSSNPDHESPIPNPNHDRIILINPFTQGMVVIDGTDSLDSLLRDLAAKNGQPPASKASIEALETVEIGDEIGECSICLEEWELDRAVKEMPCKHKFHGDCIDKWLGIHGSCPVCRFKMPEAEEADEGGERRRSPTERREIWVSFSFSRDRRNQSANQTASTESSENDHSSPVLNQQFEA